MTTRQCPVADCPSRDRISARDKDDGGGERIRCGFMLAGTPCRHPRWCEQWRAEMAKTKEEEVQ